ncbi:Plectin, partial [Dissostichus eleginoides]
SQRHITDLYEDLRDGHNLISLLEVLSGETLPRERDVVRNVRLPREKGRMRFHKLQNVQIALDFLKHRQVKLVNIRNDDIADGNPKLTLGLIWTIILHFQVQISDIQVNGQSDDMTAKEKLLLWSQRMVEGYQGLRCDNFTTGWRDGKLFNAIIHKHSASSSTAGSVSDLEDRVVMLCEDIPNENSFDSGRGSTGPGARSSRGSQSEEHDSEPHMVHLSRDRLSYRQACFVEQKPPRPHKEYYIQRVMQVPTLIDMGKVYRQSNQENLEQAFSVAERDLGVTRLLDPEDVDVLHPDEKSIITYVSSLYDAMPRVPDVQEGVKANELELRWQEYYELVTMLLQWIRHHILVFEERKFPNSYEEIEVLWRQFLKFKETELPAKESDKNRSKHIFKSFEGAVQAGLVKVPPGYHPFDVEKEWGRLHVAILERERLLRKEFERLEQLQRVVSKVQMESGVCEEQLNQVETLLQMDMRMMNSGKPAQHSAEMEADLEKAEGMIRLLFNDVQLLKDGRHLQAEQMYRRVYRLHERLVNLRSEYNLRLKSGVTTSQIPMTQIHTSQIPMTQIHTSQIPMTQIHTAQVTTLQQAPMRVRPELDEVTMRYIQDLLGWVEENQRRVDDGQWGSDLPTVESQLGSHRGLHQSVEEFHSKIQRAKADESQISPASKAAYRDYLGKLELQYGKLLNASKARLHSLDQLHAFVIAATKELIERNTNMTAKKDNYSGLMRDLELREKKVNVVQATGDKLLRDGHPARKTVEAFTGALQTQWSWLLQLCCCVETHLKENTAYYQFFSDVKEAEDKINKMQDTMKRKYTCDRSVTVTRLEDLLQDAADDKEQLTEFQTHLEGLKRRAKTIIQLKPRNPATAIKGKQPIQAVCDFKQMEITVHRGDECALLNNSQPYKWRVLNDKGNESSVPSICFLVPPTNKDAVNSVAGLDGNLQRLHTMWQNMFLDMKSMLSYQYLMRDIHIIKTWNVTMFKTLRVEEYRLALRTLELHYQDFLRDSQDSETFGAEDRMQVESNYNKANQHYNTMVSSAEQGYVPPRAGEQDESVCNTYLTQIKDLRLRLEGCENRTVTRLRQPVDKEPLKACAMKTAEQMKVQSELEGLKKDLNSISEKTEDVLASPQQTSSAPMLRSELDVTLRKMDHVYGLSSVYLDKLKTIDVVIRNTKEAEDALKTYESRLLDVNKVPENEKEVEEQRSQLKSMRAEVEADQVIFDRLQDELRKASTINDKMTRIHSERDAELEHYRQLVNSLLERWQVVFAQMDMRQRELDLLGRHMNSYNMSYEWLIHWLGEARKRQEKIQAVPIGGSKALREQLAEEKKLLEEIEKNKDKIDSCQKNAKAYIDSVKDYELQILTYKALQDPMASPLKKPKMDCASDNIIQEYVTLRTRYSELMTLTSQYIKFITETQRRLEDDEKASEKLKEEERKKMAEIQAELDKQKQLAEAQAKSVIKAEQEAQELKLKMKEEASKRQDVAVDAEQQKQNIQHELHHLKSLSEQEIKSKSQQLEHALVSHTKIEEEIHTIRIQLEMTIKQKKTAESELQQLRDKAAEAEKLRKAAQEDAERLRKQVAEETQKKKNAEDELKRKSEAEKEAAKQKQKALDDLQKFKMQAEEAERRMKQAEEEKLRQIKVVEEVAQKSAATQLQTHSMSFNEKATKLEESLKKEQGTVLQLQEEAEKLRKQQEEAKKAREQAEKELETWRQKANEALRLRLQAEEEAQKKSKTQEEAERQKVEAERDAKKRAKAEDAALKQKDNAEKELEKQRAFAEQVAQQKLSAEQECIRLKADFDHAEQQRGLLDNELQRLKKEVSAAEKQRKQLEEELAKVRSEMDSLLKMKTEAEKKTMSNTEKSKQLLESEALKMKQLADEATRLRSVAEEAKKQRQTAEEEAARQRAEAEKILKEKLAAINEATRLRTEAEIALKAKEAENERLKRKAEDEAYQRKLLEDQAAQHKHDIQEKITHLKSSSDSELVRQKTIVEETLRQKKIVEEEIHIIRINFEKASKGKSDLENELKKLKVIAEETQKSKLKAESEAEKLKKLAAEEEKKRKESEEKVKRITAAEEEAARQCKAAQEEVARLKKKADEANKQKEKAEKEAEKQVIVAKEAAQKCSSAEQKAQEVLSKNKEDCLAQQKMKEEFENAKQLAQAAEKAKEKAEKEAALLRQKAAEAEKQKKSAEDEAAKQAKAQKDAEKLKKAAEEEASKRAAAEAEALKQKKQADAEMAKHKKEAEQALKLKSQVEKELTMVKLRLDETDKQKALLDEELQRVKGEVNDAVKQKAQVEDELAKVRIQMDELLKLKLKIEEQNRSLMKKDKDKTQKVLAEEAGKMKSLAEEAARLSVEAEETARQRQIAESNLAEQRALAEKMLKEKMQAIQEATKLKAEAQELHKQKDQAQEKAKKLLEDKQQIQQRLDKETEGFQKSLEAERKRQLEVSAEAETLKLKVKELSDAQSKAENEAKKFKKQADEAKARLKDTEKQSTETVVQKLETQRLQSTREADGLKEAIADLEKEREKLKKEAEELQKKSNEMANTQKEQIEQQKAIIQQSFITERELLLKRQKAVEDEKKKLQKQFGDEVKKAEALKDEQERQRKLMEEEKNKLQAIMDAAVKKQKAAEADMKNKQTEMEVLEKKRLDQEKQLGAENQKLREKLQCLEGASKQSATKQGASKTIEVQTDVVPEEQLVTMTMVGKTKTVFNGSDEVDGAKKVAESPFAFDGIREKVPAERLHDIGVLTKKELDKLKKGKVSVQDLAKTDKVKSCLQGQSCVGGILTPSKEKISVYQALKENKITPNTATMLLEAQAASGYIVDPVKNKLLSVDEAVKGELIGPELHDRMLSAERAATGFKDPYTGAKISLFEAMKKGLIEKEPATKFLDVQLATGGIVDPINSHRVQLQTAYKQGQFDADMNKKLTDPSDDCKLFIDPSTQEPLTYKQLLEKCTKDAETGLLILPVTEKATQIQDRQDHGEKIFKIVITVVEDKEKESKNAFMGLRAPVSASELLESKIINKDLFNKLSNGKTTVKEISEMEPVKKALQGTPSIGGLLNEPTKEKMPFYQAMKKELLSPETVANLLEAQAATGFVIDPVKNERVTVDEAVKSGLVGPELHERLLSAERAVSGYKDPYTGKKVSLFEAMNKGLIKKDHGMRLLEAQLSTGGIIDPINSYRIPHDLACKRGYFDEEIGKTLNKNTDDTKVFYDPNSQEDSTYAQLMNTCVTDKETGLPMLHLSKRAAKPKEEKQIAEAKTKEALNHSTMELDYGPFKGRKVTIWEIIHSEYITEVQRLELIRQYRTGQVTIEKLLTIVITMVEEKGENKGRGLF